MMTIICCERREEEKRRENLLTAVSKLMDGWMVGRMQIGRLEGQGGRDVVRFSFLPSLLTNCWAWLTK